MMFKKAFDLAKAAEKAELQVKEIHDASSKQDGRNTVHRISKPPNKDQACY